MANDFDDHQRGAMGDPYASGWGQASYEQQKQQKEREQRQRQADLDKALANNKSGKAAKKSSGGFSLKKILTILLVAFAVLGIIINPANWTGALLMLIPILLLNAPGLFEKFNNMQEQKELEKLPAFIIQNLTPEFPDFKDEIIVNSRRLH